MSMRLVGRGAELATLGRGLVEAVKEDRGTVFVVEGAPGVGKTRLLQAVVEIAESHGLTVLPAQAGVLDHDFPFGVVRQVLEPVLAATSPGKRAELQEGPTAVAVQMLGGPAGGEPGQGQGEGFSLAVVQSLFWLVACLADEKPLLVTVDDLQWSDSSSLRWLTYLARRITDLPVVLVASRTTGERVVHEDMAGELAGAATGPARLTRLTLSGLAPGEAHEVVGDFFGGPVDERFSAACHAATGGNPFLLYAMLRTVREAGVEPAAAAVSSLDRFPPEVVGRYVGARLRRVAPATTALAEALVVLGDGADLATVAALACLDAQAATGVAQALADLDILGGVDPLRFRHSIVRSAVASQLTSLARSDAHARAARLLHERGATPHLVAAQLLYAEPVGEPWVLGALRSAAQDAVGRGAPETAERLLRRALGEPLGRGERTALLMEAGTVALDFDKHKAVEHLSQAFELVTEVGERLGVAGQLWHALLDANRPGDVVSLAERMIAEVTPVRPELVFPMEVVKLGILVADPLRFSAVVPVLARMEERFPTVGDTPPALASVLAVWHTFDGRSADRVIALGTHALKNIPSGTGRLFMHSVFALAAADELGVVEQFASAMIDAARPRGEVVRWAMGCSCRAQALYRLGRVDETREDAERALSLWDGWGADPRSSVFFALERLVDVLIDQGDPGGAVEILDRYDLWGDLPPHYASPNLLEARGRLRIERGDLRAGLDDLLACGRMLSRWSEKNPGGFAWRSRAALAHLALGEHAEARRLAAEELELARIWGRPRALGTALRTAGAVAGAAAGDTGGGTGGLPLFEDAVSVLEGTPLRLDLARALADHGGALRRAGRLAEARERLRRADDLAGECGALVLARTVREELSRSGGQPGGDGQRAGGQFARLTPTEWTVAELAVEGLTNRTIAARLGVTQRTVEVHLTSAYRKLGVSRRIQLAQALPSARNASS